MARKLSIAILVLAVVVIASSFQNCEFVASGINGNGNGYLGVKPPDVTDTPEAPVPTTDNGPGRDPGEPIRPNGWVEYRHFSSTCSDGRSFDASIVVSGSQAKLIRQNCSFLASPLALDEVVIYPHNEAVLIYENEVYVAVGHSDVSAVCRSTVSVSSGTEIVDVMYSTSSTAEVMMGTYDGEGSTTADIFRSKVFKVSKLGVTYTGEGLSARERFSGSVEDDSGKVDFKLNEGSGQRKAPVSRSRSMTCRILGAGVK